MRIVNRKTQTKIMWIIVASVLLLSIAGSATLFIVNRTSYGTEIQLEDEALNVILLIGDGMGENHIKAAALANGGQLTMLNKFTLVSKVETSSLSLPPTDSAAAATAMATGIKTYNGRLAYLNGENLPSITEYARQLGKKTGVISTKSITDATPAAFSIHVEKRGMTEEIARQIAASDIDVLIGLGLEHFSGYTIASDTRDFCTDFDQIDAAQKTKFTALFPTEGNAIDTSPTGKKTLASLTVSALNKLKNEKGFFLMVEGAKIDTYSHANDIDAMIAELIAFDKAVAAAYNYAAKNKNTLVLIVADHETGLLRVPTGAVATDISDNWYHSTNHSNTKVGLRAYGPGSASIPAEIDNTDIFRIIKAAFGG